MKIFDCRDPTFRPFINIGQPGYNTPRNNTPRNNTPRNNTPRNNRDVFNT